MTEEQTHPEPRAPGWIPSALFAPLRPAEQVLLRAYLAGDIARVGLRRPLLPSAETTVRGEFVAYLARSNPHERCTPRRVQIVGAWIEGGVDLRNATVPEAMWFYRCVFDAAPRLDGARVGASVSFPGCLLPGLRADDCSIAGNLALNSACTVRTELRLARARIGRDLNLDGLQLRGSAHSEMPIHRRIAAEGARVDGHVTMQGGFESDGDLHLVGLRVAGDLRASNARVSGGVDGDGQRGDALNLDHARIAGNITLDQRFSATGLVRLNQAQVGGNLDCSGASFDALGELALRGAMALSLERARIGATLSLVNQARPLHRASLAGARAATLVDDATTWGEGLTLDGFVYQRFGAASATDGDSRRRWLMRQDAAHLDADFRPQPWRQLIRVLRQAGHHVAAREVAVALEAHWLRIGRVGAGAPRGLRWLARGAHRLFGALAGYGYRPQRLLAAMAVIWLASGVLYWAAAEYGAMAPSDPAVYNDPRYADCRGGVAATGEANWTRCPALPVEHSAFRPFAYSLEMLLPFVDLRQRNQWTTIDNHGADMRRGTASAASGWGVASRFLSWYEMFVGWLALALLAWLALRLVERDR
jgi:hypothetical protein